jgi:hypothetical protein
MAQIIKHRRGSLEALSAVTASLSKGEIVIASGSSNLTVNNGSSIVFAVPENGQVQAVNRFLIGNNAPNTFSAGTYNGMLKGVPYYASGSSTLYLLGEGSNDIPNLVGNISVFSASVDSRLDSVEASLGGGGDIGSSVTQLNAFTASANIRLNNLESTSASVNGHIADINSYTASNDTTNNLQTTRINQLAAATASVNVFTQSVNGHIADINSYTASLKQAFTASGANITFSGNVTIPGNLTVQGTQTVVDSTTIQLGDNILELNGSGAANGGLWVKDPTAPSTATGSFIWDSTNDYWKAGVKGSEIKVLLAGSDGVVSGSSQINFTGLSGISANIISASSDTANVDMIITGGSISANLKGDVVSGSSQITISDTTGYSTFSSSIATSISSSDARELALSTSVDSRLDAIESSIGGGGALSTRVDQLAAATASVNAFTSSTLGHISDINTWSASVKGHILDINAYTASNNTTNTAQNSRLTNIESFTSSFGTSFSSSVDSRLDVLEGTGTIQGVGTGNQVTFAKVTTTGDVVVGGDLVVQGNTVTLNTSQLVVEDKLISLASGSTNAATANGAGIEVLGAGATFTYDSTPNAWTANIPISASAVTASVNVPGFGSSKRLAFRSTIGNIDFIAAPTTSGDIAQWDGTNFVMSNVIDGGTF